MNQTEINQPVLIDYTNYRGERAMRRIKPLRLCYEENKYHEGVQWLLVAVDLDKDEVRTFAMCNIHSWKIP